MRHLPRRLFELADARDQLFVSEADFDAGTDLPVKVLDADRSVGAFAACVEWRPYEPVRAGSWCCCDWGFNLCRLRRRVVLISHGENPLVSLVAQTPGRCGGIGFSAPASFLLGRVMRR